MLTRSKLSPVGQVIFDYLRRTESRKDSLFWAVDAQESFNSLEEAMRWIIQDSLR